MARVIVPDVNLLLYASVTAFEQHPAARSWWEQTLSDVEPMGLTAPAALGFVRIATHRRVLTDPMPLSDARRTVQGWLNQPCVRFLRPGSLHLSEVLDLLESVGTAGNLTTDAQIAVTAGEHRGTVYTADSDFARFTGIAWTNPLAG